MEGGELLSAKYENQELLAQRRKKKKQKQKNKRFSDDQIRSLESMFKMDTKLEPKRKLQLARELELQPRQVAIWFQNRRARGKLKHLEQEYNSLKHNYDNLNSQYQSLRDEQQTLLAQLEKLREMLRETDDDRGVINKDFEGKSKDRGLDDDDTNGELVKANTTSLSNGLENGRSDKKESENKGDSVVYEELQLLNLCRQLDSSSIPTDKWSNFDHTSSTSNWLDFLA